MWSRWNHKSYNKQMQRKIIRLDYWVGKMMHWEMSKKFRFSRMNKWYIHNKATVLENDTHKLLWDFDIKTGHVISARRPDFILTKKGRVDFPSRLMTESNLKNVKRRIGTSTLLRNCTKLWNMKETIVLIIISAYCSVSKGLIKGLEDLEVGEWVETIQIAALLITAKIM